MCNKSRIEIQATTQRNKMCNGFSVIKASTFFVTELDRQYLIVKFFFEQLTNNFESEDSS